MATVTFTYDHSRDPMNPDHLGRQIQTTLSLATPPDVGINPTQIVVTHAGVAEANRAAIQALISAYVYDATQAKLPPGNEGVLKSKAQAALTANATYFAAAAYPAGAALTTTQLTTIVRAQRVQIDILTRENNAIIRLLLGALDDVSGT